MPAPDSTDTWRRRDHEALLRGADLVILGRMPWSSNATFLCELWPAGSRPDAGLAEVVDDGAPADDGDDGWDDDDHGDHEPHDPTSDADGSAGDPGATGPAGDGRGGAGASTGTGGAPGGPAGHGAPSGDGGPLDPPGPLGRAIYKPHRGERPLWDFPDGLFRREVAAYDLACAIGWDVVPPTVVKDGPFGPGSLQWFIEADFDQHYFTLLEDEATHAQLRRLAAFDLVANSTDRKGGHVLVDAERHLWGIDNGLCLHAEFKLRTVIWDFAGEPLPDDLADDLDRFARAELSSEVAAVLDPFERDAVRARARALLAEGRLPVDPSGRRFPWPLV